MAAKAKLIEIREDEAKILKVCENAQIRLKREDNIDASHAAGIATVAYVVLREAINVVGANKSMEEDFELDFMNLLTLGISYRANDEAEKEGNFTPYVHAGNDFKLMTTDGKTIDKPEYSKEMQKIGETAKRILKSDRYIDIDSVPVILDMTRAFFIELMMYLNEERSSEEAIEVNVVQLLDVGVEYQPAEEEGAEGVYVPFARPGQEFKLLVKDDDITEQ